MNHIKLDLKKRIGSHENHLRYACRDRDYGSKKRHGFGLKTKLLTL